MMKRFGMTGTLKPQDRAAYIEAHKKIPEPVAKLIHECNIRNYSVFCQGNMLFSYYEYIGTDYAADMKKMAGNAENQKWWALVCPMFDTAYSTGECWTNMEKIFFQE